MMNFLKHYQMTRRFLVSATFGYLLGTGIICLLALFNVFSPAGVFAVFFLDTLFALTLASILALVIAKRERRLRHVPPPHSPPEEDIFNL